MSYVKKNNENIKKQQGKLDKISAHWGKPVDKLCKNSNETI